MTNQERIDRQKMIVAMDFIASRINSEDIQYGWLQYGVPDGYLNDSLDPTQIDDDDWMINEGFEEMMTRFLRYMVAAYRDGGIQCGGVVSGEEGEEL